MVIASVLMSMGMMMLPPTVLAFTVQSHIFRTGRRVVPAGRIVGQQFQINKKDSVSAVFLSVALLESITQTAVNFMGINIRFINITHIHITIAGIQIDAFVQSQADTAADTPSKII